MLHKIKYCNPIRKKKKKKILNCGKFKIEIEYKNNEIFSTFFSLKTKYNYYLYSL